MVIATMTRNKRPTWSWKTSPCHSRAWRGRRPWCCRAGRRDSNPRLRRRPTPRSWPATRRPKVRCDVWTETSWPETVWPERRQPLTRPEVRHQSGASWGRPPGASSRSGGIRTGDFRNEKFGRGGKTTKTICCECSCSSLSLKSWAAECFSNDKRAEESPL